MKLLNYITTLSASVVVAGAVSAATVPNQSNNGYDLFNAANVVLGSNIYASNADLEAIRYDLDELFELRDTEAPLIGLSNGYTNTLGWYPASTGVVTLSAASYQGFGITGDGTISDPFDGVLLAGNPIASNPLGFAIETSQGDTWYSEQSRNSDGLDHMVAYGLGALEVYFTDLATGNTAPATFRNAVLIGFEDIDGGGDMDFNDGMFLIDATPVPVPAAGFLLLGGLGGLVALRKRRKS